MRNRIKIIKGRDDKLHYYKGDGLWFGRISEKQALDGLTSGEYTLWERTIPKLRIGGLK